MTSSMKVEELELTESKSPLTGRTYRVPAHTDDKAAIDNFLAKHAGKKVVVVQGLGFVGAVMSLVVANALTEEYAVIGVDLANKSTYWKICSLNEGVFPVVADDPKIEEYYRNAVQKGNFLATYDPYVYSFADVIVVDINLDVKKNSGTENELAGFD
jgi:UDP-N-acetyl-D-glucosamine dehydrogenase